MSNLKEAFKCLHLVETTKGKIAKLQLLEFYKPNPYLPLIFKFAFDTSITYGIKRIPAVNKSEKETSDEDWKIFVDLLEKLATRKLTGNAALEAVGLVFNSVSDESKKWFAKILRCDTFRIGVNVNSINSIWPDLIYVFSCMLAESTTDLKTLKYPLAGEPKIDGQRCLILIDKDGKMSIKSRNGKEIHNLNYIIDEISKKELRSRVIDGELWEDSWNKTVSITRSSKTKVDSSNIKLRIFDLVELDSFNSGIDKMIYSDRKKNIIDIFNGSTYCQIVPHIIIKNSDSAQNFFEDMLAYGYEGAMFKDLESPYLVDRTKDWLKFKCETTFDGEIIRCEKGQGRLSEKIKFQDIISKEGVFEYLQNAENILKIPEKYRITIQKPDTVEFLGKLEVQVQGIEGTVGVGSGFSDLQRFIFWFAREWLVGKTCEFKGQKDPQEVANVRFPVFKKIRFDK